MITRSTRRPGTFVPILAICATALFSFVALATDLGMLAVARTECQNAADASALAGARLLNNKPGVANNNRAAAEATARTVVTQNDLLNANFTAAQITEATAMAYEYQPSANPGEKTFEVKPARSANGPSWSAMRVEIAVTQQTYFANVMGISSMNNGAVAVAVHRPRDIALVLDFSVSMRFGSVVNWETGYGNSNDDVSGLMSPDPNYPKFGHYQRYLAYNQNATPNDSSRNPGTVANRANPLFMTNPFTMNSGEVAAQSNLTVETPGGPPAVFDFRFDPANVNNPTTPVGLSSANTGGLWNAFHRWFQTTPTDTPNTSLDPVDQTNVYKYAGMRPAITSESDILRADGSNGLAYVRRTFNWTGYDPLDRTNRNGPTPAPDFFATQADSSTYGVNYAGDRFPRKKGQIITDGSGWDPTTVTGAAVNVAELLGWDSQTRAGTSTYTYSGTNSSGNPPDRRATTTAWEPGNNRPSNGERYNNDWRDFRDATWEKYGYSLDIAHYVANRDSWVRDTLSEAYKKWDPRWEIDIAAPAGAHGGDLWKHVPPRDSFSGFDCDAWPTGLIFDDFPIFTTYSRTLPTSLRPRLRADGDLKGYSMGPGYWGKTFVLWPADPRAPVGQPGDADFVAGDWRRRYFRKSDGTEFNPAVDDIDNILFTNGTGSMLRNSGYQVKYDAILGWLRSGPQTLPPNLRSGRILYYSSISRGNNQDQRFWEAYIDHVLGITNSADNLAGDEPRAGRKGRTRRRTGTGPSSPTGSRACRTAGRTPTPSRRRTTRPTRPGRDCICGSAR